ncbi:MAG: hypothetical protein CVV49_20270 [Spirochaetae bacterium HGW-Spirochaetae-5]|nr:MAG: hypothetical protein CVV49_20270 [Spirochaetae bacterium HGW-Spirochaetae-5]
MKKNDDNIVSGFFKKDMEAIAERIKNKLIDVNELAFTDCEYSLKPKEIDFSFGKNGSFDIKIATVFISDTETEDWLALGYVFVPRKFPWEETYPELIKTLEDIVKNHRALNGVILSTVSTKSMRSTALKLGYEHEELTDKNSNGLFIPYSKNKESIQ